MFVRVENRKGNVYVVSKMYIVCIIELFLCKSILYCLMEEVLNIYRYIVYF